MEPFPLHSARLTLNQPIASDIDRIAEYCSDPLFERFMATPWPYDRDNAGWFVSSHVPEAWSHGTEWTWAIREADDTPLLGIISVRLERGMVGYWLGAPHRGRGVMPEALGTVIDAIFERTTLDTLRWECVVGNHASCRVAQKAGFVFTGERPGTVPGRDGVCVLSWTGELHRDGSRPPSQQWPLSSAPPR